MKTVLWLIPIYALALPFTAVAMSPVSASSGTLAETLFPTSKVHTTEIKELSANLAKILNSEDIAIGDVASDEKAAQLMLQLFGTNEELKKIENEYPGVGKELANVILPIINRQMRLRLPQLQELQSNLYAEHFSAPELAILINFYSSPFRVRMKVILRVYCRIQIYAKWHASRYKRGSQYARRNKESINKIDASKHAN